VFSEGGRAPRAAPPDDSTTAQAADSVASGRKRGRPAPDGHTVDAVAKPPPTKRTPPKGEELVQVPPAQPTSTLLQLAAPELTHYHGAGDEASSSAASFTMPDLALEAVATPTTRQSDLSQVAELTQALLQHGVDRIAQSNRAPALAARVSASEYFRLRFSPLSLPSTDPCCACL